ncbi:MAG: purine-nucleoside phosphorylase [Clostridia bacterium]|nr:purine-nucleoside phosphorylase [Clostridia bacterium]
MGNCTTYPTPHINATPSDFAKTVLMPGDPLRAKFIAENFLKDAVLVNNVRGVQGYTGTYKGTRVSVMASGMGMPSIGIYSYELYNFFGVENIIRVGSAGAMQENIKVRDLVFGMAASTNSSYPDQYSLPGSFAPTADFDLLMTALDAAKAKGLRCHVGNILSSDTFYNDDPDTSMKWARMGVMAVEMEAAALYCNAAKCGKRALAICTISDSIVTGESLDSTARQNSFTDMMTVALDTASAMESL